MIERRGRRGHRQIALNVAKTAISIVLAVGIAGPPNLAQRQSRLVLRTLVENAERRIGQFACNPLLATTTDPH